MSKDDVIGKSGPYRVRPRVARGFRDLVPQQMFTRQRVIDIIRGICELYGYVPLYTPAVERLDVLEGSAGEKREVIIRATVRREPTANAEQFGLRFDLTVPLARVIAQGTPLPLPFRRYQVAPVWRAGDGGESHEREFTMFDLDAVGVGSEVADTEIIAAMCDTLRALDVGRFTVRYSNRELLKSLFTLAEIPERAQRRVMEIISSRNENGIEKRRDLLTRGHREGSGPFIPGVDLTSSQVERIEAFLAIRSTSRAEVIERLKELFANASYASAGIDLIERISAQLGALGFGDGIVEIDLSVVRSHMYYTGPVFEATLSGAEQFGAIFFGGRYDKLVERFGEESIAATGASIHIDHLIDAIALLSQAEVKKASARVFVANIEPALVPEVMEITWKLRRARIQTQLYTGTNHMLVPQLRYAEEYAIPVIVVYGPREHEEKLVSIRDMTVSGTDAQKTAPLADVVAEVRKMLDEIDQRFAATSSSDAAATGSTPSSSL